MFAQYSSMTSDGRRAGQVKTGGALQALLDSRWLWADWALGPATDRRVPAVSASQEQRVQQEKEITLCVGAYMRACAYKGS